MFKGVSSQCSRYIFSGGCILRLKVLMHNSNGFGYAIFMHVIKAEIK